MTHVFVDTSVRKAVAGRQWSYFQSQRYIKAIADDRLRYFVVLSPTLRGVVSRWDKTLWLHAVQGAFTGGQLSLMRIRHPASSNHPNKLFSLIHTPATPRTFRSDPTGSQRLYCLVNGVEQRHFSGWLLYCVLNWSTSAFFNNLL